MANICSNKIKITCSPAEYNELKTAFKDNLFDWPLTYDGYEFSDYGHQELSFNTAWTPLPIDQGAIDRLSEFYPSAIFKYFVNPEGGRKFTSWYCGGEDIPEAGIEKRAKMMCEQEINRFLDAKKSKSKGIDHEVALMGNGKVAADGQNIFGECDVLAWNGIIQVSCGNWHTVGLTQDGRVIACGSNANQQCQVDHYSKVSEISCGRYHTAILHLNGAVSVASLDKRFEDVSQWSSIKRIISIYDTLIGLKNDNSILIAGDICPVSSESLTHLLGIGIKLPRNFLWKDEAERKKEEKDRAREQKTIEKKLQQASNVVPESSTATACDLASNGRFPDASKEQKLYQFETPLGDILVEYKPKAAINRIEREFEKANKSFKNVSDLAAFHHEHHSFYNEGEYPAVDPVLAESSLKDFLRLCLLYTNRPCLQSIIDSAPKTKTGTLHKNRLQHLGALMITNSYNFYELVAVNEEANKITLEIRTLECTGRNYSAVESIPSCKETVEKWCKKTESEYLQPTSEQKSDHNSISSRFDYKFDDINKTAKLVKYSGDDEVIVVPQLVNGYSIIGIGKGAFSSKKMHQVILPNEIQAIENDAFLNCTNLQTISIPDKTTEISWSAFKGCSSLQTVKLPNNLTMIEPGVFSNCTGLQEIKIPEKVSEISVSAFEGCTNLTNIQLPKSLQTINDRAFSDCSKIKTFNIPNSVKEIGSNAFAGCKSLVRIAIPPKLERIKTDTFLNCINLESVIFSQRVRFIGGFSGCIKLREVIIPEGAKQLYDNAFYRCIGLKSVVIPNSMQKIGAGAFADCQKLENVTIPESLSTFFETAFIGTPWLKTRLKK